MRWGEYEFCDQCEFQIVKRDKGYIFKRCRRPIRSTPFPKNCNVPERQEIKKLTQNVERKF